MPRTTRSLLPQRTLLHQRPAPYRLTAPEDPPGLLQGLPGLTEVHDGTQVIGFLTRVVDGYDLRDLTGNRLETVYVVTPQTAAGILADLVGDDDSPSRR